MIRLLVIINLVQRFFNTVFCEGKGTLDLDSVPEINLTVGLPEYLVFDFFVIVPVFCILFVLFVVWVCTVARLLNRFFPEWFLSNPLLLLRIVMDWFSDVFFISINRIGFSLFSLLVGFTLVVFFSSVAGLGQVSSLEDEKVPPIPAIPTNIEVVPSFSYGLDFFWEWLTRFIKAKFCSSDIVDVPVSPLVVDEDAYNVLKKIYDTPNLKELHSEIDCLKIPEEEAVSKDTPFWTYCWRWLYSWTETPAEKPLYNPVDISEASGEKYGVIRPTKSDLSGIGIGKFSPKLYPRIVDAQGNSLLPRALPLTLYGKFAEDPISQYISPWVSLRVLNYYFSIKSAVQGLFGFTYGHIYKHTGFTPKENLLLAT